MRRRVACASLAMRDDIPGECIPASEFTFEPPRPPDGSRAAVHREQGPWTRSSADALTPPTVACGHRGAGGRVRQPAGHLARRPRAAWKHHDLDRIPAARRGRLSAVHRGRAAGGAHLRRAAACRSFPSAPGPPSKGSVNAPLRRRLDRLPRHEPGAGRAPGRLRLRRRARHHPDAAQRAPAGPGPVLPRRSGRRCFPRRHGLDPRLRARPRSATAR